jgi:hypothetical protein
MGGGIISESGGGIIPLRGAQSSRNWGTPSPGISTHGLIDRLKAMRGAGESYNDVILRIAKDS